MITWTNVDSEIVDNGEIELINGKLHNLDFLIGVTINHRYFINIVDMDTKEVLFNGNTDSLTSILKGLEDFRKNYENK